MSKLKKIILSSIVCASLPAFAFASPYSAQIVNKDQGSELYSVDYTVCSDYLEKNPTCSEHKQAKLDPSGSLSIDLNSEKDVVYVWSLSSSHWDGPSSDYSKEVDTNINKLKISGCVATSDKMIVLNSFGTQKVACDMIFVGKPIGWVG